MTFGASETEKSFTVTATDDSADDDRESVAIGFGSLPAKVSAGSPSEAVVQLTDNDAGVQVQSVQVRFDARAGAVRDGVEEGGSYRLGIRLNAKPGVKLTIPLTYAYLGGATAADFSGLPANVTFGANGTSTGVTIRPVDDFEEDPGESLKVSFGSLPAGVSVNSWSGRSTIIPVIDNDATPGLSVSDASAREWPNPLPCLIFVVTMDRMDVDHEVSVDYATRSGTAVAGQDFTPISGTLVFRPSESKRRTASKSLCVKVLDDAHDEGVEQMTLVLSNPVRAYLVDGTATGSISNSDPMPEAWLARFGRTAATHVTDAVGERLRASPGQESQVTVGGYRLPLEKRASGGAEPETTTGRLASLLTGLAGMAGLGLPQPAGVAGTDPRVDRPESDPRLGRSQTLTLQLPRLRDVLLGSSFRLNLGDDAGPGHMRLTAWGRVAGTRFDGRDGDLTLDGDVLTGTVGVDGEWDRLLAGVAVAHSRGQGGYTMPDMDARGEGDLETALTSLHPYLRYAVTERLDVWGLLGYGWGDLTMQPGADATFETDTTFIMGAFGSRGILLQASDSGGFELATRTDAMLTRTSSDAVTTGAGNLASSEADAHRVRLVLEGSRGFTWPEGRTLTPTLEIGLRHDWGDAETGFGLELGGRVQYADPTLGLTIEGAVRGLLAHEDSDYQEWGASGSLRIAPGAGGQGLSLTLSPTWGAASSGIDGLWSRQTTAGLAPQGNRAAPTGRLNAEIGYGVAAPFSTGLLTPYAGTVLTDGAARTYRLGTRWTSISGLTLNLEGQRQEPAADQPINQGLYLQIGWGF